MKKISITCLTFIFLQLLGILMRNDTAEAANETLSSEGRKLFSTGEGAVDETTFVRIASRMALDDFRAALYGSNRAYRRIALNAAAYVDDPWVYIPYLVSFLSAAERQSASEAARAMFTALTRVFDLRRSPFVPLKKQAAQLNLMLLEVATNTSLEPDVRVQAVRFAARIEEMSGGGGVNMTQLLSAEDEDLRLATLGVLTLPLKPTYLQQVAKLATQDESLPVRGIAVGLLCENAHSHSVAKPSSDLKDVVVDLLNASNDALVIAPILPCIARFPYRTRAELTDRINNCGNEKVIKYWKTLSQ
ncbi:MAG: hypothetical protein JXR76_12075 [Deltaproteobacteria bacterium]|nr:hypothetical protein [Deltaproteobacteria bacterium]